MFIAARPIVLASGSPRRRDFFDSLGIAYEIDPAGVAEPAPESGEAPADYAERMARLKAFDVAGRRSEAVVVGADSIVTLDGLILGKPRDAEDAVRMLKLLRGRTHQVVTGCCLVHPEATPMVFHAATNVRMSAFSDEVAHAYAATGEPLDKAGAYAVQGRAACLVEHVEGSYTNVVGLPLARVLEVLVYWGVIVPRQG